MAETAVAGMDVSAEESRLLRLDTFSAKIKKKLDDAVAYRLASGIELEWWEDGEAYEGIDDANRPAHLRKPLNGSTTGDTRAPKTTRSTVFMNVTEAFVNTAAANMSDMLQPTDDRAWSIKPPPVKALIDLTAPVDKPPPQVPLQGPDGQPLPSIAQGVLDWAATAVHKDNQKAEAAQKRIDDWHIFCNYHGAVREMMDDWARLGSGVLKGPFPVLRKARKVEKLPEGVKITMVKDTPPASKRVDPWNLFPDPNCGENIHNGSHIFERDYLSGRQLRTLRDDPHYITSQIDICLREGPAAPKTEKKPTYDGIQVSDKDRYEVFYFTGDVSRHELEAASCDCGQAGPDSDGTETFSAEITIINGRIVKANLNPLESGELPYDVIPWAKRSGMPWGRGVSRQMRSCQRIVNGAVRNLMDNAGLAAGGMLVIRDNVVVPADGVWELTPRKIWKANGASGEDLDVSKVFNFVEIPSLQEELLAIVKWAQEMAETVTSLPQFLQGQQGEAPDTVGGMQILSANASAVKRRFAKAFDDFITEPHIKRYYEWLLLDPDVPDEEKGDFQIDARGSSALVARDLQNKTIAGLVPASKDPAYKLDPAKTMAEYLKSQRLDPSRFQYEPGKEPKPQPTPEMLVAQATVAAANAKAEAEKVKSANDTAIAQAKLKYEAEKAELTREHEATIAQLNYDIAAAKVASQQKISLDDAKAMLAATVIKSRTDQAISDKEIALEWDRLRRAQADSAAAPADPVSA